MEVHNALHEADPFSFDSVCDDGGGSALDFLRFLEGVQKFGNVVSIYFDAMPAKGLEFLRQWFQVHYLAIWTIKLQVVVVYDSDNVVEFEVGSSHGCLPDLTLVALPVAQKDIYSIVFLVESPSQRHTDAEG